MRSFIRVSMGTVFLAALLSGIPSGGQRCEAARAGYGGVHEGGEAVKGPRGGEAVEGPRGNEAVRGPAGNVAVGTRVTVLPANASTVVVGGNTYYMAGEVYYQPYYSGAEVTYVVVVPPLQ